MADPKPNERGRAWVEIDLDALSHNAASLRSLLPDGCDLMAVVKADAYGHGADAVARRLERDGVGAFAVATLNEGIRLRERGITGEILVLGYTHPADAVFLNNCRLSQLVVDGAHARALDESGYRLRVHIALDTGMHRLGIEPANLEEIRSVFACKNLAVEGLATHTAAADSLEKDDVEFTELQYRSFLAAADELKGMGYDIGRLHAQPTHGLLNYPEAKFDYARVGIALYGVMSSSDDTVIKPSLRPVLALRAIVAQVRWIGAGQSVSYGRAYRTDRPVKLATVDIGYADGVPRQMSGGGGACIVKGRRAPIVGRICMDMLMLDVTGIDPVAAGDIVTLIGRDGDEEVRCEDFAEASGTITNDILSRLGRRLPRLYSGA